MENLEDRAKVTLKQIFNGYYENFPDKLKDLRKFGAYKVDKTTQRNSSSLSYVVERHTLYHFPEGVTAGLYIIEESKKEGMIPHSVEVELNLYGTEDSISKVEKILENDK